MPTITKFGSAYAVSSGAVWTTPTNIYADDSAYAITAGSRNTNWDLIVSGFNFSIPSNAIINSVTFNMEYKLSTTASASSITFISQYNGAVRGTNWSSTTEPTTDTPITKTDNGAWTVAELNSSLLQAVLRVNRTSNTACNYSFDYVSITVDYTVPVVNTTVQVPLISSNFAQMNPPIVSGVVGPVKVMSIDAMHNLWVKNRVVVGSAVSLSKDGTLTVKGIAVGEPFRISASGVLTAKSIVQGGVVMATWNKYNIKPELYTATTGNSTYPRWSYVPANYVGIYAHSSGKVYATDYIDMYFIDDLFPGDYYGDTYGTVLDYVYRIDAMHVSSNLTVDWSEIRCRLVRDAFIGEVQAEVGTYPDDGIQGGFWYTKQI
jgi:hypothetical protein